MAAVAPPAEEDDRRSLRSGFPQYHHGFCVMLGRNHVIALRHKQVLSDKDLEEMFEATLAAIESVPDPIADAVAAYIENLRIASQPET
jgi:hypothetical protein